MGIKIRDDINRDPNVILNFIMAEDIINLSDVEEAMRKKEMEEILKIHPYSIYQDSRKRWCTYIKDENFPGNRRLIAKSSLAGLQSVLYAHYSDLSEQSEHENISLEKLYPEWYEFKALHVKSTTMSCVRSDWKRFYADEEIVKLPIRSLTPLMLDAWIHKKINEFDMDKSCFANFRSIIYQELEYAVRLGIIAANPLDSVKIDKKRRLRKRKKKDSETQVFSESEQAQFIAQAWKEYSNSTRLSVLAPLAVVFLFYSGLRISEVCALRYEDLRDGYFYVERMLERDTKKVVNHTKGNSSDRRVPLVPQAMEIIDACRKRQEELGVSTEGYIFSITDDPVPYYAVSDLFRKYCNILNIPHRSAHATRRTFISTLIDANININTVRETVGHSSEITTLNNYCFDRKGEEERRNLIAKALQ